MATKFRLLFGKHTEKVTVPDRDGNPVLDAAGNPQKRLVTYTQGQTFESEHALDKMFNGASPAHQKFEVVTDETRVSARNVAALERELAKARAELAAEKARAAQELNRKREEESVQAQKAAQGKAEGRGEERLAVRTAQAAPAKEEPEGKGKTGK